MRFKYKLLALAALSIAVTQTITPAIALPKQSVKSFLRWAKSRPLPTLQQNSTIRTSNKQYLSYVHTAPQSEVNSSNVTANKDTTVRFSKYNEKALKLILKLCSTGVSPMQCKNNYLYVIRHRVHRESNKAPTKIN
ncbi:hypothetical protein NIES4071_54940 [Calothrix sp. NIES-4071]|nr:hypothetical protein NIES4071_54940 [Calothrix sp. NIES-4071]BAZ59801.1 hypothetical protein NIES4105_54890 [Calothrix sp. NIES-4105]